MTLDEILEKLREPEKIVSPQDCNFLSSYLAGFISDYEEELHDLNLTVSNKWLELREKVGSDTKADRALEVEDIYRRREKLKLTIKQLSRLRADLRDRYSVITNTKRY